MNPESLAPTLEDLAKEAKQYPPKTLKRRAILSRLIAGIDQQLSPARTSEESEARQQVYLYLCQNIEKYRDGSPVINWVSSHLKYKRINIFNEKIDHNSLDVSISKNQPQTRLEVYQPPQVESSPLQELVEVLKEDPEGLFQKKLFKKNPRANFRAIALKRIEGVPWKEITADLGDGFNVGPISTFYQRCCKAFAPQFKEYLQK